MSWFRRLALPAAAVIGGCVAGFVAVRLRAHHIPVDLTAACALAVFGNVTVAIRSLIEGACAVTHRCPVPGCAFRIRLTNPDAAESRRWQEAASAHPTHAHTRRH
ncbi:hypothetical protein ACFWAT_16460 [Streptomyces syringium]|uniref:hypothetical protein n=1 Tax=Streptomyces syringium TaxID=76729 RepID=UPI003651D0EB